MDHFPALHGKLTCLSATEQSRVHRGGATGANGAQHTEMLALQDRNLEEVLRVVSNADKAYWDPRFGFMRFTVCFCGSLARGLRVLVTKPRSFCWRAPPQPQPSTRRRNSDAGKNQEKVEQAEEDGQESDVITGVLLFIAFHAPIPARVRSNAFTPTCCGSRRRGKFRKLQKDGVDFAHQLSEVFRVITLAALSHGFRHNCPDDQIDEVGDVTDTRVWTQSSLNAELPQKAAKERRHPQIR